ncbi:MAG: hypothetical protein J6A21_12200 [Lentisphaeria bacterium]|nr:hypothetical protein [Lentisphaeria bacterium]
MPLRDLIVPAKPLEKLFHIDRDVTDAPDIIRDLDPVLGKDLGLGDLFDILVRIIPECEKANDPLLFPDLLFPHAVDKLGDLFRNIFLISIGTGAETGRLTEKDERFPFFSENEVGITAEPVDGKNGKLLEIKLFRIPGLGTDKFQEILTQRFRAEEFPESLMKVLLFE